MDKSLPRPLKTVLFLCTGNYYRSRFAEILFNALAEPCRLRWRADSAGLDAAAARNLGPISPFALEGLRAHGIRVDARPRQPRQVTEGDLCRADLVVAMKHFEHRPMVEQLFPHWAERIEYWHIDDVDCALPEDALRAVTQQVRELIERLEKRRLSEDK